MRRMLAERGGRYPRRSLMSPSLRSLRASWLGRIGLSSFWLLAARILGQGLGLLFTALLARALGKEGLGQFAFLSAVLFVGNAATTFGLDTVLLREAAAARRDTGAPPDTANTIGAVLLIQLALSSAFIALLWLVMPRLPNQTAATLPALRLMSLALVLWPFRRSTAPCCAPTSAWPITWPLRWSWPRAWRWVDWPSGPRAAG